MEKIIVTADLGRFKAYRFVSDPYNIESPRVEPLDLFDIVQTRQKLSEQVSDAAGRFKRAAKSEEVTSGCGERHNIELEKSRRAVKAIAQNITALIKRMKPETWDFAACADINKAVLAELENGVKGRLQKNLKTNLTNAGKSELVARFQ